MVKTVRITVGAFKKLLKEVYESPDTEDIDQNYDDLGDVKDPYHDLLSTDADDRSDFLDDEDEIA